MGRGSGIAASLLAVLFMKVVLAQAQQLARAYLDLGDLVLVIGAAAADSVNPCIMSVMVLLLSQLSMIRAVRRAKKLGATYIISIYVSYFILGLLIAFGLNFIRIAAALYFYVKLLLVGIIAFAGIVNVKDFFFYGKGISFGIPKSYAERVEALAMMSTVPAIIILASLVTLIEFPCSGMMYVAILTYLISKMVPFSILALYLALYNAVFVLPEVLILLAYLRGASSERIEGLRLKYRGIFRLIMGLVLLGLAYLVWVM